MKKKIWLYVFVGYFVFTLPVTGFFVLNEYFRFQFFQTASHYYSKLGNLEYIFIGDSITAGGRNWANWIGESPLKVKNLAGNGYTTKQIISQATQAIPYKSKYLFVLAGTNDVFSMKDSTAKFTIEDFRRDYTKLIRVIKKGDHTPIFTLIPYQSSKANTALIDEMNSVIKELLDANDFTYINLNEDISKEGVLLDKFTVDGVHFSDEANEVWGNKLKKYID